MFFSPIKIRVTSTYTPAATDDYKSGFLVNAFVFRVFDVAKECRDDREVFWSSRFGGEGQRRNGDFIDMRIGVGEGIVDEDDTGDERDTQHSRCCCITCPAQKLSRAVQKRSRGRRS